MCPWDVLCKTTCILSQNVCPELPSCIYAWMRGEEITSCKSHIASVSLSDWCIMIQKQITKNRKEKFYILLPEEKKIFLFL